MTVLTQDKPRTYEVGRINEFNFVTGVIYEGAAVGDNGAGFARPLVAGDKFLGFCERPVVNLPPVNNSPGLPVGDPGDRTVRVVSGGLILLAVTGVIATSVGAIVYASDEDTFTLTPGSNSPIGRVYRVAANGQAVVAFGDKAVQSRLASHVAVLGGTHTTTGGSTTETINVPGVLATDIIEAHVRTLGATPRTIEAVAPVADHIQVTWSGDPGTDHVIDYLVYRTA